MLISPLYLNGHKKIMGSSYEVSVLTTACDSRDVPCNAVLLDTQIHAITFASVMG